MSLISQEKISEIINKADIVNIISSYIQVSKKGRNYWSVCPFHDDNAPSMSISPEKKIYKCFSCGASGNVVKFIENYTKVDFLTALKKVAETVNISLDELNNATKKSKYNSEQEKIFQINKDAMDLYRVILNSKLGEEARQYLEKRKINQDQLDKWNVGFASSQISIFEKLTQKGYSKEELISSGLISEKDGKIVDYYFNRIIFPILNEDSKVIGFSARTLQNIKPKYINSRENIVFKKSELAYNINNAITAINMKKSLIVLEGFMDVISLDKIGINNSIAIMGTSLSEYHLKLFKKMNVEIKMFLDGDKPGVDATLKAINKLMKFGIKTSVINNTSDKDPDELINDGQSNEVVKMIENSIYPINFAVDRIYEFINPENPVDLNKYLSEIFGLINIANNDLIKDQTFKLLSKKLSIESEKITLYFNKFNEEQNFSNQSKIEKPVRVERVSKKEKQIHKHYAYERAEKRVFISLLKSDEFIDKIDSNLDDFNNVETKMWVKSVIDEYRDGRYFGNDISRINDLLTNKGFDINSIIEEMNKDKLLTIDMNINELEDSFIAMQEYKIYSEIKIFETKIAETDDYQEKKHFMKIIQVLQNKLISLKNKKKRGI